MSEALDKIINRLEEARRCAAMERASFGFPNDRVTLKSIHGGDVPCTDLKQGQEVHPDAYIKSITKLYRETWIIPAIDDALALMKANAELLERCTELRNALQEQNLDRIAKLARAGRVG